MAIVAGVDFGTLSVRVTLVDTAKGRLGSGTAEYPLHRKKEDPDYATQSHEDHMRALAEAVRRALAAAKVPGGQVAALAAGAFPTIEKAQEALCPKYRVVEPDAKAARVYEELYGLYRELYFGFGKRR